MIRTLLALLLVCAPLFAHASDPIPNEPAVGNSNLVRQPHVTAELIPDFGYADKLNVVLHLHTDPGWHTYWINPGDAGLATRIEWTLPDGFTAGPILWPTPEKHLTGTIMTYGYDGDVYLPTTITLPVNRNKWPLDVTIKAHATWLVCKEECIPGKADLSFRYEDGMTSDAKAETATRAKFFAAVNARLPATHSFWKLEEAKYTSDSAAGPGLSLSFAFDNQGSPADPPAPFQPPYPEFFPEQANVLSTQPGTFKQSPSGPFQIWIPLAQNGEKPDKLSGILITDPRYSHAVYISEFPVSGVAAATATATSAAPAQEPAPATTSQATGGSDQPLTPTTTLLAVLAGAFIGGLILNLMPCVLPVLSLKVFSLMKHAGENRRAVWLQGVAFTAGVIISFWLLAGILISLEAAGKQLGWGFQMQNPQFVLALIFIFFLLGLNLFGVFEFGTSLVGLDARASSQLHGINSSFLNGALATLAATPCTGPFMGPAVGFAAQQPPFVAMLVFTFLALGLAAPYLLLTIFPGALRFVPKPGAWMEAFRQFMGFLLMATVVWLIYVFGALTGEAQVPWLLAALLPAALAAWIYGRWNGPVRTAGVRFTGIVFALVLLAFSVGWGITIAQGALPQTAAAPALTAPGQDWQPWSAAAVDAALAEGRPVFVDFTAAWCVNCMVNERLVLDTDIVKKAFADKNVALFRADWTHADPDISKTLKQFNRDGVPLYLLYSPKDKQAQVLPDGLITTDNVLSALKNL